MPWRSSRAGGLVSGRGRRCRRSAWVVLSLFSAKTIKGYARFDIGGSGQLKKGSLVDNFRDCWTGGRVVEGTGLENRHTGEPGIESSNLSLSVFSSAKFGTTRL